ncbi:MAG: cob(I)yrinic acid a,c-diamide adenosyltransferase [Carnobacterium sp.]
MVEKRINLIYSGFKQMQQNLFDCGTDLATPHGKGTYKVTKEMVQNLEKSIDSYSDKSPEILSFVLPRGHPIASLLHMARTVVRRAERSIVSLASEKSVNQYAAIDMNRLSDYFFAVARAVNNHYSAKEILYERGGKICHPELKKEDLS